MPNTGVLDGDSPNGSFTVEPLTPACAVRPPLVSVDDVVVSSELLPSSVGSVCVRSTSAVEVPAESSDSSSVSSERSDATPLGSKPTMPTPARAAPGDGLFCPATRAGARSPAVGSLSTSTASASAHGSPLSAFTFELSHDHELRCVQSAFANETRVNTSMIADTMMIDGLRRRENSDVDEPARTASST